MTTSRTYVTLCIYSKDMKPDELTKFIGFNPDSTVECGDKITKTIFAEENGWFWGTKNRLDSIKLDDHLMYLVRQTVDKIDILKQLKSNYCEIKIFIFWESNASNGGPIIKNTTLKNISNLPADLDFDIWTGLE